ncbi:MAG TPA: tetratricopeptide repeat protein [Planctomycetota bacterium]|nr:tetratricopeptide repeat protein [Planctomycetota bacterium]
MKHQWTVGLVGAALLGIPAIASQQGNALASLQTALESTKAALEELVGLEPRIVDKDPSALQRLMDLTEEPKQEPQQVDETIVRLRTDIQRLQNALDLGPSANGSQVPAQPSTGLDLASLVANPSTANPNGTGSGGKVSGTQSFEDEGYSANEMAEARLQVRAGKYSEAIEILRKQPTTPESRYWLARALQGLGDTVESRELLRGLAADGEQAHRYARWATQDLRMIELREKLDQQAKPQTAKTQSAKTQSANTKPTPATKQSSQN